VVTKATIVSAVPVLYSIDIGPSVTFYEEKLGFRRRGIYPNYAVLERDGVEIHLGLTDDSSLPKNTQCRVNVAGIEALYAACTAQGIVHPKGPLTVQPWGFREFSVLDLDGNLIKFGERV
jgi:hypothetical protein